MENCIITTMCMIYDNKGNILVQDRVDDDWPGVTFPGGHVEHCESFCDCVVREIKEETGLDIENPVLCGIKQFQTEQDARYIVIFFKTDKFSGTLQSSDEGEVFWIPRKDLEKYRLSSDFDEMISIFENDNLSEFYWYKENNEWKKKII